MFRASHDDRGEADDDELPLVADAGAEKPIAGLFTGEVVGTALVAPPSQLCTFTRPELQELLKESRFGVELGPYNAYFRPDPSGDGGHVCRACGLAIGSHCAAQQQPGGTDAAAVAEVLRKIPPPNITLKECAIRRLHITPHFAGADAPSKWLPFLRFDGFAGIRREDGGSFATARWRCTAPNADGSSRACGATFFTEGAHLNRETMAPSPRLAMGMRSVIPDEGDNAIAAHFAARHHLEAAAVGRWSSGLLECCEDPRVAAAYLACPYAFNSSSSTRPDVITCSGGCVFGYVVAAPIFLFAETVMFIVGLATLCGFPFNSESIPPMSCKSSYENRRVLVAALGVEEESPMRTRCTTVFCLPCSECQMFREQRNSGAWPGLLCCTANDQDKSIMAPSAVRARYSVNGYYSVRPMLGAPRHAHDAASLMLMLRDDVAEGPLMGWSMT